MNTAKTEQRQYHAMRLHIEQLLAKGWSITGRDPLRLEGGGRSVFVQHGMLIGDTDIPLRAA